MLPSDCCPWESLLGRWPVAGVWELWGLPSIPRTDDSGSQCPHWVHTARLRLNTCSPPGRLEFGYVAGRGCLREQPAVKSPALSV